ncbi:hypothetical protein A2U01_0114207, partial [Trifolium medium]|nr:hypothetical protein [Trifolium medium]
RVDRLVRSLSRKEYSIWRMIGQLVSELNETLEVEKELSAKCYFWTFGDKKVNRWRRVEHEY